MAPASPFEATTAAPPPPGARLGPATPGQTPVRPSEQAALTTDGLSDEADRIRRLVASGQLRTAIEELEDTLSRRTTIEPPTPSSPPASVSPATPTTASAPPTAAPAATPRPTPAAAPLVMPTAPPPRAAAAAAPPAARAASLLGPPDPTPAKAPAAAAGASSAPAPAGRPATGGASSRRRLILAAAALGIAILGGLGIWLAVGGEATPAALPAVTTAPASPPAPISAPDQGTVLFEAVPWGEVAKILDQAGREMPLPANRFTPFALALPPGRYTVTLTHPDALASRSCALEIGPGAAQTCRVEFRPMDATEFLQQTGWWR